MSTAGALVTDIISDLGRSDTSISDTVLVEVKSAIRDYEAERFYFNEQLISLTVSVTDTYALSLFAAAGTGVSDIIEIDEINVIVNATRQYALTERPYHEISAKQNNGISGYPREYATFNQSVIFYPKPNATYTVNMAAHVKFTELSAFSDSNPWTNDASQLIRNAAEKRFRGRRLKDYEGAQAAEKFEQSAWEALKRRTDALSGSSIEGYL